MNEIMGFTALARKNSEDRERLAEYLDMISVSGEQLLQLLNEFDAFAIGTPTITRDAVPPVWELLAGMDAINSVKRPCAVFGAFGWSGEGCANVAARLQSLKCALVEEPLRATFVPTQEDLEKAKALGVRLAEQL